jgi:Domain of unknown function (DUF3291)
MKSPWKSLGDVEPDQEYVVLASSIPALKRNSTWPMFRGSRIVHKQLLTTDGVVGFSLLARPWKKEYATLSVWTSGEALDAFAATSPHREMMSSLAPRMGPTKFVRWTIRGADGLPTWDDALRRLA